MGHVGASLPPGPPAPPRTPVPLASLVRFPARTRPGYPGAPSPTSVRFTAEVYTPAVCRAPAPGAFVRSSHRGGSRGMAVRSSPSPSFTAFSQHLLPAPPPSPSGRRPSGCVRSLHKETHLGAAGAQPRPCGAHGASPGWASSPSLRPGPSLEPSFFTRISACFGFPPHLGRQRTRRGVPRAIQWVLIRHPLCTQYQSCVCVSPSVQFIPARFPLVSMRLFCLPLFFRFVHKFIRTVFLDSTYVH